MLAQDERLARTVGTVTLILLAAAIAFVVFVADRIELTERVRVTVYFHHTGGLQENAPIIVGGREIGHVEAIVPARGGRLGTRSVETPGEPPVPNTGVAVTVAIDAEAASKIARGGDVFVAGRGPLSARHLEIGPAPDPDAPPLAEGDEITGSDPPTLDRVLQRTWDNLNTTREFAQQVAPEFDALRVQLRALASTIDGLAPDIVGVASLGVEVEDFLTELRRLREVTLGGEPGLDRIAEVIARARATVAQARIVLDTLGAKATALRTSVASLRGRIDQRGPAGLAAVELAIERMRAAIDKIDPLLAKVADLNARIARGEGSLGRLMRDPEFPEDAKELGKILKRQPWRIFARPKE